MRIFVKNISESQENCIKGDLASCNTVYAQIRREPNIKTTLYIYIVDDIWNTYLN